ncbi:hypothetical protein [Rhizobium bangladeshense]|uniref:hypothetical protein n=1 Tax=Rhizobium bangladeshense TaxID=1138189 RepID=UPI001C833991|nr:hypothetical protein [Rhizobium bangladeshense]MBX4889812.1 hypothetical protein [Rhizobium bangladeshense]
MNDLMARIDDLKQREVAAQAEYAKRISALNKAITLVLTLAAVGVLTFISIAPTEQKLKTDARINQENVNVSSR